VAGIVAGKDANHIIAVVILVKAMKSEDSIGDSKT